MKLNSIKLNSVKLNKLNNLHFLLAGTTAVIITLFAYMWLDMRSLEASLLPEAKPTRQMFAIAGNASMTSYHEPIKEDSLPRQRMEHVELAEASATFFRKQAVASTSITSTSGFADDWMFERGEDVETQPVNSSGTPIPEKNITILSE